MNALREQQQLAYENETGPVGDIYYDGRQT